jgi:RNA polymerase sigma-70 factor (ECF subfamily)
MSHTAAAAALLLPARDALRQAEARPYVRVMEHVDGVSTAIETVLARFRTMVRSVGARRGLVDADLDEVMQEVRIRLWQAGKAGKTLEDLGSSYLYQVATTASLDLIRRKRARAADRTDDVDELIDLPAAHPSPHEEAEASDLSEQIESALETLAPDRRVAVRFYLTGYDRNDIARALGWSEARARNLLYRGLDDLRRRLTLMGVTPARAR